jgi:hypothetical protein
MDICFKGNVEKISTILNSTTAKFKPDNRTINQAVLECYFKNKFEVVKYFLEAPELKDIVDINYKNGLLFRSIYADEDYDLLNYLIFDRNIEKIPRIVQELQENPSSKVEKMFLVRDLPNELSTDNNKPNKRPKI